MSRQTSTTITKEEKKVIFANLQEYVYKTITHVVDSATEMVITVIEFAITSIIIYSMVPPSLAARAIASVFMIYFVLFLIMLVRKFDDHYTVDELAEKIEEEFAHVNEKLDDLSRNV